MKIGRKFLGFVLGRKSETGSGRDCFPSWAKPYKLHTTTDGITIAFIGLTVAYPEFYQMLDWHIEDPLIHLESILEEVRDEAHITVVLSPWKKYG